MRSHTSPATLALTCSEPGCKRRVKARNLCGGHYRIMRNAEVARRYGPPPPRAPDTKFDPAYHVELIENLALLSLSNSEIAKAINVTDARIDEWVIRIPAVREALSRGREQADGHVARALYRRAVGYDHTETMVRKDGTIGEITRHYPPDTNAASFWLRNRHKDHWRDRIEHTGADGAPLSLEMLLGRADEIRGAVDVTPAVVGSVEGGVKAGKPKRLK